MPALGDPPSTLLSLCTTPQQTLSQMAGKVKVLHVGHLSPIFTAYVLESAQQLHPSQQTPQLGHSKSSAFQPVSFQITSDPWCISVLKLELGI